MTVASLSDHKDDHEPAMLVNDQTIKSEEEKLQELEAYKGNAIDKQLPPIQDYLEMHPEDLNYIP
uniref:Uncharacterized protein n=1 Tax=Romanomermis culicivorax TaxID=13658 RepID=A0A915J822_ROMCU